MTVNSLFVLWFVVYGFGMFAWGARWRQARVRAEIRVARERHAAMTLRGEL